MNTNAATLSPIPSSWRSPSDALGPSLRAINAAALSRMVFLRYPEAKVVAERLAWHLTDRLPFATGGAPLLHLCLSNAFDWLHATHKQNPSAPAHEALTAFFIGLFKLTPFVAELSISSRDIEWDAIADEPLTMWLKRHRGATCRFIDPDVNRPERQPVPLRAALVNRLIMGPELIALRGHLQPIYDPGT